MIVFSHFRYPLIITGLGWDGIFYKHPFKSTSPPALDLERGLQLHHYMPLPRIMLNPVWKSPSELDHQLPSHHDSDNSLMSQLGLRNVVIFCSTRVWRGGFRLLLQASALFFAVFVLFGLLPARISGGSFHNGFLSWGSEPLPEANLRIVVFGSPDIMGSATDASRSRRTWTEELCEEVSQANNGL